MSEMVDRVEMAIDRCGQEQGCRVHPSLAKKFARAAIKALREPNEEMIKELQGYAQCAGYIEKGWAAAIDAVLKD